MSRFRSMEPPNSKKRVYSGSSSRLMDPEVVEIPPSICPNSKLIKQKEVILHNLIDIDKDEDSPDVMFIGERVPFIRNKGKEIESIPHGYDDHQAKELLSNYSFGPLGPASGDESSNNFASVSHNLISHDGHNSDMPYEDEKYIDHFFDDYMDIDEYTLLQAHFDKLDIPTGIEAPIPWLVDLDKSKKKSVTGSSSLYMGHEMQSDAEGHLVVDLSFPSQSFEPPHSKTKGTLIGSSAWQTKRDSVDHPSRMEPPSTWVSSEAAKIKKKSFAKKYRRLEAFQNKRKFAAALSNYDSVNHFDAMHPPLGGAAGLSNYGSVHHFDAMKLPLGDELPFWGHTPEAANDQVSASGLYFPNLPPVNSSYYPFGIESTKPGWQEAYSSNFKQSFINNTAHSSFHHPFSPPVSPHDEMSDNFWVHGSAQYLNNVVVAESPVPVISNEDRDEILRKFQLFKQFDTVEDTSDHHYTCHSSSSKQPSKNWAKKIQEEWKILEKDLPDSIFVRVYEARMDLLRAVIIGAEGTPYHDGLFFFDVFFPIGYPNAPPQVYYHSGGLRLNPNLYHCGKVCLSLLNTWSGGKNEKWIPGVSTILQVLVSIQGLILNAKPYFNEPGYAHMSGLAAGEMRSLQYNEDTFILSLRTMVYIMRRPPKHFEEFVWGHFCNRAHDILVACKAYMDGAQVGCLSKGGVQDVDEGDKSSSKRFKDSLPAYLDMLVKEFTKIGARGCENFLSPEITGKPSSTGLPTVAK
ncbi:Ubiquitin-conjugating enzyme like [Quillaja saponaria]|uniref:E2 ubiquitin-conjugating enzyme n=1 Tax=Quillaja saponaria TaxID=32244 RepID=A0AAD7QHU2_QUISA|nr:Ubiquitin-conjugating enzyme like [Quillaja saponaria]